MRSTASKLLEDSGVEQCPVDIDPKGVEVRSVPMWLRWVLRDRFSAITFPWAIYIQDSALDAPGVRSLLVHELAHLEQWRRLGYVRFLRVYLGEYFAARRSGASHMVAYYDISLETEARAAAGQT